MEVQTCEKDERKLDVPKIMEELKLTGMGKRVSMAANTEKYVRNTESVDKLVSHVVTIAEGSKDEPTLKLAYIRNALTS